MTHTLVLTFVGILSFLLANKAIDLVIAAASIRANHYKQRRELMDEFEDIASQFLRRTENLAIPTVKAAIVTMPAMIFHKKLAFKIFFSKKYESFSKKDEQRVRSEIGKLSTAQEDMLSQLIGSAFIAATYSFPLVGMLIRRTIFAGIDRDDKKVGSTQQAVMQFRSIQPAKKAPARIRAAA